MASVPSAARAQPPRDAVSAEHASSVRIVPFDAPLGAEVIGLDLSQPLDAETFARIHQAHLDYHVLVFREQRITPAQQVAFSRRFGPLQIHVLRNFQLRGHPEVLVVSNIKENGKPIGLGDAGHYWHSDLSYKDTPSLGSLLHAQELPSEGGDTLFANQHLAWQTLPAALKQTVQDLRAEHSYLAKYEELRARNPWRPALTPEQIAEVKPVQHPVVRTHRKPAGKRCLSASISPPASSACPTTSAALLQALFDHSTRDALVYRHRWQPHDMVFWDNRSVMHLAAGTPDHLRRRLNRTTIEGDAPF